MKHIKFFENIKTEEDISDYFLDLIDNDDLKFKSNSLEGKFNGEQYIRSLLRIKYTLNRKYLVLRDIKTLNDYSKLLNKISFICNRWKLSLQLNGLDLSIDQELPNVILNILNSLNIDTIQSYNLKRIAPNFCKLYDANKGFNSSFSISVDNETNFVLKIHEKLNQNQIYPLIDEINTLFKVEFLKVENNIIFLKILI